MTFDRPFNLPTHVGLIMDGNGRWAKKRLLPRSAGHRAGMERMIALADKAREMGIKYLTVYALSTENLKRPQEELSKLYDLIKKYFSSNVEKLLERGAAVKVIGDISLLPQDVIKTLEEGISTSPDKADFTFIIALAYGSRHEIARAADALLKSGERVDEVSLNKYLYTDGVPDPDLIIRTGGEMRLSNFLLWQAAYAELYFTPVLFPDFSDGDFERAIQDYGARVRKFGNV